MVFNKHALYGFFWIVYVCCLVFLFDVYGKTILFFGFSIVGLGAWLYHRWGGIITASSIMAANTLILLKIADDPNAWKLTYYPTSIITGYALAMIVGILSESRDELVRLSVGLENTVADRTRELDRLAKMLIARDESERNRLGQDIHDGVGQYLTGMLLHSEALHEQLKLENKDEAELAREMTSLVQRNMQLVRHLARTLFPIKIIETGLEWALRELTSYFGETTDTEFSVNMAFDSNILPPREALQIYRIIHEAVQTAMQCEETSEISIDLSKTDSEFVIVVENNGKMITDDIFNSMGFKLMKYRAHEIKGKLTLTTSPENRMQLRCTVPMEQLEHED